MSFCKDLTYKVDRILGILVCKPRSPVIQNNKDKIVKIQVKDNLAIIDKTHVFLCRYNELNSLSTKISKQPNYSIEGEININGDKIPLILYKSHKGEKYAYFRCRLYKLFYSINTNFNQIITHKSIEETPITKINNLSYFKKDNKISKYFILGMDDNFINIGYLSESELLLTLSSNIRLWNIKSSRNKFTFTMHYKNGEIIKVIPSTKIFPLKNIKIDGNIFYRSNSYLL